MNAASAHVLSHATLSPDELKALHDARHGDPFSVLGIVGDRNGLVLRAFLPGARAVTALFADNRRVTLTETGDGLFEAAVASRLCYRLQIEWSDVQQEFTDPYFFGPVLSAHELAHVHAGATIDLPDLLGANPRTINGVTGFHFAVWAPHATAVSLVGDHNCWDARRHPMRLRHDAGVWEIFIPGIAAGTRYKFAMRGSDGHRLPWKADPMARCTELPPCTASIVAQPLEYSWQDEAWMAQRMGDDLRSLPLSIYETHIQSWLATPQKNMGDWDEAADRLIPYALSLGFTHIELLPIAEYPFGGSWGYQPLSLFAPTARMGKAEQFARFVDRCHRAGLGVILDWVPAHFPNDAHGLAQFDGTALYEHADPRQGFHPDWNSMIYNYGRSEVRGFLIASAIHWLKTFHLDGLRVDAVASMLYRDYSRKPGEWVANHLGGRENFEAVHFLQTLNETVARECPGAIMIAEESTAWPGVTRSAKRGGLGFNFKWNMGWMHDTLRFMGRDPVHRRYHHDDITFGLHYGFSENYILPLSHDEVVHGKGSLLSRMPGDEWQRFANLRLLYALMWTHPGKKLLFMGGEFAAAEEWRADDPFPWPGAEDHLRQGMMRLITDLNRLYRAHTALHLRDTLPDGFSWIVKGDPETSVFVFRRSNGDRGRDLIVAANATPVPRHDFRIGVPAAGVWRELFNSDAAIYGGSNVGNCGAVTASGPPLHDEPHSMSLTIPPLGLVLFAPEYGDER